MIIHFRLTGDRPPRVIGIRSQKRRPMGPLGALPGAAPDGDDFLVIGRGGPLRSREPGSATALPTLTEPPARHGPRAAGR